MADIKTRVSQITDTEVRSAFETLLNLVEEKDERIAKLEQRVSALESGKTQQTFQTSPVKSSGVVYSSVHASNHSEIVDQASSTAEKDDQYENNALMNRSMAAAAERKQKEEDVMGWVRDMMKTTGVDVPQGQLQDVLKDGTILCKLMKALPEGKCGAFNKKAGGKFQQMENAQAFQKALKDYGLPDEEIFQPVDLVEARNISQVVVALMALARKAQMKPDYNGPTFGPKECKGEKREFTQAQLDEAKACPTFVTKPRDKSGN